MYNQLKICAGEVLHEVQRLCDASVRESLNCFTSWIPTKCVKEKVRNSYPLIFAAAACLLSARYEIEKKKKILKDEIIDDRITVCLLAAYVGFLGLSLKQTFL